MAGSLIAVPVALVGSASRTKRVRLSVYKGRKRAVIHPVESGG